MLRLKQSDILLAAMRDGKELTRYEKLVLIITLSIPSVLAQMTSVVMFYIDAAMVGHLGAAASASIGITETATWLFGGIASATSIGFSVQVAHQVGAKEFDKANMVFRHGLLATTISGLLLGLIAALIAFPLPIWLGGGQDIAHDATIYFLIFGCALPFFQFNNFCAGSLKSTGNMLVPGATSIAMCLLDMTFNYIFIYGCNLGVAGAALGTFCAVALTAAVCGYFAIFRSDILSIRKRHVNFKLNKAYFRKAFIVSLPTAVQYILMNSAQIVCTRIVAPLGNVAIAANSFAITVESLCYMPGYGIGDAAQTLTGQSLGAGRTDMCKGFAKLTVITGMIVMAVTGFIMYVFAPQMIGFITPVEEIRELGTTVLRIEAFAEPMFAAAIVSTSVCIGAGDTRRPMIISLCTIWFVRLSLAAFLATQMGLAGVWTAMAIELFLRGVLFLTYLKRGSWVKFYEKHMQKA